jgi:hypothetical protein
MSGEPVKPESEQGTCAVCSASNPKTNRYCGNCGYALDPSGEKLRQQIRDILDKEFKDPELVAVTVADSAEERLWKWGKLLGLAGAFAVAGFGFFGFTSYQEAKKTIQDASTAAVAGVNDVASKSTKAIENKGKNTIDDMQNAETTTLGQISNQASSVSTAVRSVASRAKVSDQRLAKAEQEVQALRARYAPLEQSVDLLTQIRTESPGTPIGNISSGLFDTGSGASGLSNTSFAGLDTESLNHLKTLPSPYKSGASGDGVTALQQRLKDLQCYSGPISGQFDDATGTAVDAFVLANGRPRADFRSLTEIGPDFVYAPSAAMPDSSTGTVDYYLWQAIFSSTARACAK